MKNLQFLVKRLLILIMWVVLFVPAMAQDRSLSGRFTIRQPDSTIIVPAALARVVVSNPTTGDSVVIFTDQDGFWEVNTASLPVKLVSFSGVSTDSGILLEWTTATETDNYGFQVQKDSSGYFVAIGFVQGAGTVVTPQTYQFLDEQVIQGETYRYRLKQIDRAGQFEFSSVIEVHFSGATLVENIPDDYQIPIHVRGIDWDGVLQYDLMDDGQITIRILNIRGQLVRTFREDQARGTHTILWDKRNNQGVNVASGWYSVMIINFSHEFALLPFILQEGVVISNGKAVYSIRSRQPVPQNSKSLGKVTSTMLRVSSTGPGFLKYMGSVVSQGKCSYLSPHRRPSITQTNQANSSGSIKKAATPYYLSLTVWPDSTLKHSSCWEVGPGWDIGTIVLYPNDTTNTDYLYWCHLTGPGYFERWMTKADVYISSEVAAATKNVIKYYMTNDILPTLTDGFWAYEESEITTGSLPQYGTDNTLIWETNIAGGFWYGVWDDGEGTITAGLIHVTNPDSSKILSELGGVLTHARDYGDPVHQPSIENNYSILTSPSDIDLMGFPHVYNRPPKTRWPDDETHVVHLIGGGWQVMNQPGLRKKLSPEVQEFWDNLTPEVRLRFKRPPDRVVFRK